MSPFEGNDAQLECKVKKVTERISENIHIVANEPSLAFYRLQEHVRKALPPMVDKRMEVGKLHQELQGRCYDAEYAVRAHLQLMVCLLVTREQCHQCVVHLLRSGLQCLSAVKAIENAESSFQTTQDLLRNALFFKQQLKYKESQRSKESGSVYKRLSAHITLDLPDLPELSDALRETASKVESIMNQAKTSNFPSSDDSLVTNKN
ncbi:BLOC-1-related complex subunit 8 homolog isoform X1 [Rhodnius prolixus]|uniref:BLOC-1-related complex subunit 8 homolog isoform X1 n=1 Tax=Rhodnius prolixus TaxID=13249 RepID=UPI003D1877D9